MPIDPRWRRHTTATLLRPRDMRRRKRAEGIFVAGIVGYSGSFDRNPAPNAQARAVAALAMILTDLKARHPALIMASGATDLGVPGLAYAECVRQGIEAIGVTAAAAMHHPLAPMQGLVPVGRRFGDESKVFVELCDGLWILGGGAQSAAEVALAHAAGTPICVLQGLGGAADAFDAHRLPGARFLAI